MARVCVLLIHDTRDDYLHRTLQSARDRIVHFDEMPLVEIHDRHLKLGFAGAIQEGWARVLQLDPRPEFVFHIEGDFEFKRLVPLGGMRELLQRHPQIAQVSLKRQPWNTAEIEAGGIVERMPEAFTEMYDGEATWTEHRRYFTTNPSLYRTQLCERGWPQRRESEGLFTLALLRDEPETRFAIWGSKYAHPMVEHIGVVRAGGGY